jgi:hypothetical protein
VNKGGDYLFIELSSNFADGVIISVPTFVNISTVVFVTLVIGQRMQLLYKRNGCVT